MPDDLAHALTDGLGKSVFSKRVLVAMMLKVPDSGDKQIDEMIRAARVLDLAEGIASVQAADPTAQKDLLRTVQRHYLVAQQIQSTIEKLATPDTTR